MIMVFTTRASLGRSAIAASFAFAVMLLTPSPASAQPPPDTLALLPSTALADQRPPVVGVTVPPVVTRGPAFWELISGYEGDSDGSGYAFFGPSFVRPIRPGLSWTARAFGNYLAYEFSGLEGSTHVRSPGISTGIGLQFGDRNFFRVLAGPEVKWRRTEVTGLNGVSAAESEAQFGVNAGGEMYTNPTSHNNLHGIVNYNTTDKYSWARVGFKEQLNNKAWERPNTMFLGVEGIVQGNSDIRARQLGGFFEFSRVPAKVSLVFKAGYKRSTFDVGPAKTGPYFSVGFYRRMN
jgi:hypothetical protein